VETQFKLLGAGLSMTYSETLFPRRKTDPNRADSTHLSRECNRLDNK